MIAEGRQIVHEGWWVLAAPLAALFATVVAFNQLGEGWPQSRSGAAPMTSPRLSIETLSAISLRDGNKPVPAPGLADRRTGEAHGLVGESGAGEIDHRRGHPRHHPVEVGSTGGRIDFEGTDLLFAVSSGLRAILGRDIALIPQDP